jgi:hypothetical protein
MSESNQSPGIKLTPLLLLAIPLAMYSHSKGIGIEDIRNYLFGYGLFVLWLHLQ